MRAAGKPKAGRTRLRNPAQKHTIWVEYQHSKMPGKGWPVHWRVLQPGEKPKPTAGTQKVKINGAERTVVMEHRSLTNWAREQLRSQEGMTGHVTAPASKLFENEGHRLRGQGPPTKNTITLAGGQVVDVTTVRKSGRPRQR